MVGAPKFKSRPTGQCAMRRYVSSWRLWMGASEVDGLHLDDHGLIHDQICSIRAIDLHALIQQRQFLFRFKLQSR